ncbi:MFS general substrate transporter [Fomitiporia mediterranea MF3/22]|uniref:MFS general substrate transporter n=1 Tax=Fomitiporia mediterranea (strain MF3/22) TaxID=694068 RepID=UPI000440962C|nr:MFS general substrate transporter [Fomitiporia mediterranea MF3/22]EJD05025.1 MFS general substrate transporter [Fomitiporia mediterranea MF3/22]
MASSSSTSRTTSFDDLEMSTKRAKFHSGDSPASDSSHSFAYDGERLSRERSKGEERFGDEQPREKVEDEEAVQRTEEVPDTVPQLTFPDGGWKAWGNIAGCTLISLTAFGQVNSFGVFQGHYATDQLSDRTASDISWIGSVQVTLLYISGLFLGRVLDVYGARGLLTAGCLLSTFSACMLSLSKTYYQIFLSQAIGMGLGVALQFYPLLVIPAHWFRAKRAAVVGIVVAGSSLGGIIFPIMLSRLFDSIGFAWSVRAMALFMFVAQAISIPFIKERLPPSKNKKIFDFGALKEIKFLLHCLGGFFSAFAIFTPFWYIELFMLSRGSSASLAFYSIAIMNAAGMVGRIFSGYIADRLGRFNTVVPIAGLQTLAVFAIWTTSMRIPETIIFAILFGAASASYLSIASSCVAQITKDQSQIGTRTGMFMAAMAPGILAGPPIAGALLSLRSQKSPHATGGGAGDFRYLWAQFFGGALLLVGACFEFAARVACSRKIRTKV